MVLHNTTSDPYCGVVPMFSYAVPLKCNVALIRDSHSRLDHSQSTIEGVTYEKRPRDKFVLESLNSQVTINSYSGVWTLERADFLVTRSCGARYLLVRVACELWVTSVFASSPASAITFHHVKNQKAVYAYRCFVIWFISVYRFILGKFVRESSRQLFTQTNRVTPTISFTFPLKSMEA